MEKVSTRSPWWWIPTLYFAEGIPYFIVNNISVVMFTRMGVPNESMALYTGLLYLPWTIKPLWSPFVDILKTKRWWIVAMQALITAAMIFLALSVPRPDGAEMASRTVPVSLFTTTLILFLITAFASATHDIAADGFYMLALPQKDQSFFVGIRSTFYRLSSIFGQGVLVWIAGALETSTGDIPAAWRLTLLLTSVIFAAVTLYHVFIIPRPDSDKPSVETNGKALKFSEIMGEFGRAFATFFKKRGILIALLFLLLYRIPEALMLKMVTPFFLDNRAAGGMGLTTSQLGLIYGTIGVIALTVGGIVGGIAASRWGLKKALWPMALSLILPNIVYVYMSLAHPASLWVTGACVAFEQFGYGFGFTAYMLYMIYFSDGEFKTSHYAICTAFMALSMMIPGMLAGYLWKWLGGYVNFFITVMACCLLTVAVTFLVKVDPEYGKK
ncbi:MAG: MFS transporter [Bacteroidales bacterium]|nr:MFS transporter [Bacteroidales bacterium]